MRNYQVALIELQKLAARTAVGDTSSSLPFRRELYISQVQSCYKKQMSAFDNTIEELVFYKPVREEYLDVEILQSIYHEYLDEYRAILVNAINGEYGIFHQSLLELCLSINEEFETNIKIRYNSILTIIGRFIEVDKQFFDHDLSVEERLLDLERFARREGVAAVAKLLFPELQRIEMLAARTSLTLELPTVAPEQYVGLRGPESPPEFVKRVYGPWLGQGLTRAHLGKLDPKLYTAINNWLSRPGNVWPDDVDLPTKSQHTSRMIDKVQTEGTSALPIEGPHSLKALASLEAAQRRRASRNQE